MKSKNKKQSSVYAITLLGILLTTFFIYSCSTDDAEEYNHTNEAETEANLMVQTWDTGNILVDSVANTNEFYEFKRCGKQLADKVAAYTDKLSDEEYDRFMEKLNDDEYMEDFIQKADLKEEIRQLDEATKGLHERTVFLRLSEDERQLLFGLSQSRTLGKRIISKTRGEGNGNSKCEQLKQAAYEQAEKDYYDAINRCENESTTVSCYAQASTKYRRALRVADKNYEACIQGN